MDNVEFQYQEMIGNIPQTGTVQWIGLRPARREELLVVVSVQVDVAQGLVGDRLSGKPGAPRQVTLIQEEHIRAMEGILQRNQIDAGLLRRNIVVSGVNLTSLQDREFHIGSAILKATGPYDPCSRMEENLGPGGYNAMRGHGGITATVIEAGEIRVGDEVKVAS